MTGFWFTFMGWNMRSPTLTKWFGGRRARQIALIVRYRPAVLAAVEVGTPSHALSLEDGLGKAGHPMKVVKNGGKVNGKWRYIYFDPKVFKRVVASGLYTFPTQLNKDEKQMAWAVLEFWNGIQILVVAAHLENDGTEQLRVNQARDMTRYITRLNSAYKVKLYRTFVYVDTNGTGEVQRYLNSTGLESLLIGARHKEGTSWRSQNRWLPRSPWRKVSATQPSMDMILSGDVRNAGSVVQPDAHESSDHDPLIAEVLKV